jgi:hypothetical protein
MLKIVSEHRHTTGFLLRQRTSQRQRMTGMYWLLTPHAPTNALTTHTTHVSSSPCCFHSHCVLNWSVVAAVHAPAPLSAAVEHRLQVHMPRLWRTRTPQRADTFAVQHTYTHTHTHTHTHFLRLNRVQDYSRPRWLWLAARGWCSTRDTCLARWGSRSRQWEQRVVIHRDECCDVCPAVRGQSTPAVVRTRPLARSFQLARSALFAQRLRMCFIPVRIQLLVRRARKR